MAERARGSRLKKKSETPEASEVLEKREPKAPIKFFDSFNEGVWCWYFASGSQGERNKIFSEKLTTHFDKLAKHHAFHPDTAVPKWMSRKDLCSDLQVWCFITLNKFIPNPKYKNCWYYFNMAVMRHAWDVINDTVKHENRHVNWEAMKDVGYSDNHYGDDTELEDCSDLSISSKVVKAIVDTNMDPDLVKAITDLDSDMFKANGLKRKGKDKLVLQLGNPHSRMRKIKKEKS